MKFVCNKCGRKMDGNSSDTCSKCLQRQKDRIEDVKSLLKLMSYADRLEAFEGYCKHCGGLSPCCCWNDE
jgi:hypothetical protein